MLYPLILAVLGASALGAPAPAEDKRASKPVITVDLDKLNNDLENSLESRTESITPWDGDRASKIPKGCADMVQSRNLTSLDVDVFDVKYSDSDLVYAVCRHKDAEMSAETLIDWYGKMPGLLRTLGRHVMVMPQAVSAGSAGVASGDNIAFFNQPRIKTMVHELGHTLDTWCPFPGKQDEGVAQSSKTKEWQEAYNADSVLVSDYADTNPAENFAELIVHAMYDKHVPGGLDTLGATLDGQPAKPMYENEINKIFERCGKYLEGTTHVTKCDTPHQYPVVDK